jgi:hypothetical protein
MSEESGKRGIFSLRMRDLDWRHVTDLLSFTASVKAGLGLVLGA